MTFSAKNEALTVFVRANHIVAHVNGGQFEEHGLSKRDAPNWALSL